MRMVTRKVLSVGIAAVLSLGALAVTQTAQAGESVPQLVTDQASDLTPQVTGGQCYPGVPDPTACRRVLDLLQVGDWIYAAGIISNVTDRVTHTNIGGFHDIFRFSATTHRVDASWKPQLYRTTSSYTDSSVTGLATDGNGTLYAAGSFLTASDGPGATGVTRKGVAAIDISTGNITPFNAKVCFSGGNCVVNDVKYVKGTIWLGGRFTNIGGTSRTALASVNSSGALTDNINVGISGQVTSTSPTKVHQMAINPQESQAAVIGNFTTVGGATHKEVVILDIGSNGGVSGVNSWNAPTNLNASDAHCSQKDTWARGVDWDPTGTFFDIAASGGGGQTPYTTGGGALCDAFSRFKSDGNPNTQFPVVYNGTGFDSEFTVTDVGPYVYLGGHNKNQNKEVRINGVKKTISGRAAESHYGMAAITVDPSSPNYGFAVQGWNHTTATGRGAGWASALSISGPGSSGGGIYIGGDSEQVGSDASIQRLAYFPSAG